ncbi:MAG: acyl dehydratase [Pirellulaceae bacterium]|jgi:acyl dehydratase
MMGLSLTRDILQNHIGENTGKSPWVAITQENVNAFADVTIDPQFIHVDPEQAALTPFGGTIAHGFLTLSMLSYFATAGAGTTIEGATMGINYGFDKVRFLSPVRVGSRIRGKMTLLAVTETKADQFRVTQQVTVEIEGEDRPALIAEWLTMAIVA